MKNIKCRSLSAILQFALKLLQKTVVTWSHFLSEVINALVNNGITIESLYEHPFSPYNCFEGLEKVANKGYQLLHKNQQVPLIYSIKGRK